MNDCNVHFPSAVETRLMALFLLETFVFKYTSMFPFSSFPFIVFSQTQRDGRRLREIAFFLVLASVIAKSAALIFV